MLGASDSPSKDTAEITRDAIASLGFDVTLRLLDQGTLYSKYCSVLVELKKIDVCGFAGWIPDFTDPFAMLTPNFAGDAITATNNSNPSLFDDPQVNAAMDRAALIDDPGARAKAWAAIDRQLVDKVAAVPFDFDVVPNITSRDVQGVIAKWNASWDLAYMSLR
jgi:peptide/nickel transport system substrate-binding protein